MLDSTLASASALTAVDSDSTQTAKAAASRIARTARRRLAIGVVCTYACVLFLGTHWPRLQLPNVPMYFSIDKVCHFTGYLVLTFLLLMLPVGIFRRPEGGYRTPAWFAAALVIFLVAGCSFLDEITQPLVERDMDRVDWACDVTGAVTALCLVTALLAIRAAFDRTRSAFVIAQAK